MFQFLLVPGELWKCKRPKLKAAANNKCALKAIKFNWITHYATGCSTEVTNHLALLFSRFRSYFRSVFCCLCLRSESAKQRYKHHQYKKRARYSECQTNQTRIRCISSHTVAPMNENGKALRESHRALRENRTPGEHLSSPTNNRNANRQCQASGKHQSNKRHCPSAHNHPNGQTSVQTHSLAGQMNGRTNGQTNSRTNDQNGQLNDRSNEKSNSTDPNHSNNPQITNEVNIVNNCK